MLQDKLGLACERHTEITGYTIGAQHNTNHTSTNNFAYLTGRNFGLDVAESAEQATNEPRGGRTHLAALRGRWPADRVGPGLVALGYGRGVGLLELHVRGTARAGRGRSTGCRLRSRRR